MYGNIGMHFSSDEKHKGVGFNIRYYTGYWFSIPLLPRVDSSIISSVVLRVVCVR